MKHFSCKHLEEGINFDMETIMPCCPGTKHIPPAIPFSGGTFPDDAMRAMYQNATVQNQTPQGPCIGCPSLHKRDWSGPSGRYRYLTLNHFRRCNSRCTYCDAWHPEGATINKQRYQLADTVKEMIDKGRIHPKAQFTWGGGEPTLLSEFEALVHLIDKGGYRQIVHSNAIRFSNTLARCFSGGRIRLQVSLDSGTPETYYKVKGRDIFDRVVANLSAYAAVRGGKENISLKYIMKDDNCGASDIDGFITLCKKMGITRVTLSPEASEAWNRTISERAIEAGADLINKCHKRGIVSTILYDLYGVEYSKQLNLRIKKTVYTIYNPINIFLRKKLNSVLCRF